MKPVTEIQISVVQRDKNICYQTCRKTHKKTVIASLWVRSDCIKKKEDEPRCSTEWHFGSDERGCGYCCFQVNFVLKPYWLPLYLYKKYSRRFIWRRYQINFTLQEVLTIIFFPSDFWGQSQQLFDCMDEEKKMLKLLTTPRRFASEKNTTGQRW